jgi:hypothetical protein
MKNIWSKDLTSKVILVFVSLIFSSVDLAASAKTADKSAAPQSRFAKRNVSRLQRSSQKKEKLRKPDVIYYQLPPRQ